MPRRITTLIAMLCALVCGFASGANAQDGGQTPKAEAEAHYQTAVRLFGEGRYGEALKAFDKAIELAPESIFYCNRAIVLIQLGEPPAALENLELCQRTFAGADAELASIDAQRAALEMIVHGTLPSARRVASAISAPAIAVPVGGPEPEGWHAGSTGWLLLGLGGALVASGVTLDLLSADLAQRLEDERVGPEGGEQAYKDLRKQYATRRNVWLALTGGGAVFVTAGAALLIFRASTDAGDASVEAAVDPLPGGVGTTLTVRW